MIIVNAFAEVRKTHNADTLHQTKNFEKFCFTSRNLRSSPALRTRMKRNKPNLSAHMVTRAIVIIDLICR